MAKRTYFCPSCAEIIDARDTVCPRCGAEVQFDANEILADLALKARKKSIIPWGLIIFFALYLVGVKVFVDNYYKQTAEYRAAVKFRDGDILLGDDDGKTIDDQRLAQAFTAFVEGTKLSPREEYGHMRLQTIMVRLNERNLKLTDNQRRELDLLAKLRAMEIERRKPILLIGARDIWDIDALEELPAKLFRYSLFVAIFLMTLMMVRSWLQRRHYDQLASEKIEQRRVEEMDEKEYAAYVKEKRRKLLER